MVNWWFGSRLGIRIGVALRIPIAFIRWSNRNPTKPPSNHLPRDPQGPTGNYPHINLPYGFLWFPKVPGNTTISWKTEVNSFWAILELVKPIKLSQVTGVGCVWWSRTVWLSQCRIFLVHWMCWNVVWFSIFSWQIHGTNGIFINKMRWFLFNRRLVGKYTVLPMDPMGQDISQTDVEQTVLDLGYGWLMDTVDGWASRHIGICFKIRDSIQTGSTINIHQHLTTMPNSDWCLWLNGGWMLPGGWMPKSWWIFRVGPFVPLLISIHHPAWHPKNPGFSFPVHKLGTTRRIH